MILYKLINNGKLQSISEYQVPGCVSAGKEENVYF
jgi:serine/threonine-protein kinase RIO1